MVETKVITEVHIQRRLCI